MNIPATNAEQEIWRGSPSQWVNFRAFLVCGVLALLIIAAISVVVSEGSKTYTRDQVQMALIALGVLLIVVLGIAFKRYLDVRCRVYEISNQRIRLTRGILSKRTDGLELYRVDDTLLIQPFLLRLIGKGNIRLVTADRTNPSMLIEAIPQPRRLWDQLRQSVEACRDRKGTRVLDFERNTVTPEIQ